MPSPGKLALFEQTMLPHLDAAFNLARWLAGNETDAQDIVQEAYLRAFRFFDGFRGGDGKSWLLAVVRNTSLTWRRRERAMAKVEFDEALHESVEETAEARLVADAGLAGLRKCMEALPQEYREVLVMRELEEMAYKEIAEVANLPIGTVMSRLARARQRLQDCLRKGSGR